MLTIALYGLNFINNNYLIIQAMALNIFIELLAEAVDLIGGILAIPANIVLDLGSYLHHMAIIIQHRNDDIYNNEDKDEE